MKKSFLFIICSVLALCSSCQKMPEASHTDSVVIFSVIPELGPAEGTLKVTVYATTDWSITGEDWLDVSPAEGSKGISETELKFKSNTTGNNRQATLFLKAGTYTHSQTVTQTK